MYLYNACDLLYYHAWLTLRDYLALRLSTQPPGPLASGLAVIQFI